MEIAQNEKGNLVITVTDEERDDLKAEIEIINGYCEYDDVPIANNFFDDQLFNSDYKMFGLTEDGEVSGLSKDVATYNSENGNMKGVCEHWVFPDYVAKTLSSTGQIELVRRWFDMNNESFTGDTEVLRDLARKATLYDEFVKATIAARDAKVISYTWELDVKESEYWRGKFANLCVIESYRISDH